MSRFKIEIDPMQLEKLAEMCCTTEEVAAWFRCSRTTVESRIKRDPLKTIWERGMARGKIGLRRAQMNLALNGHASLQIWLGKQLLGQTDKVEEQVNTKTSWVVELPKPMSPEEWAKTFGPRQVDQDRPDPLTINGQAAATDPAFPPLPGPEDINPKPEPIPRPGRRRRTGVRV